MAGGFEVAFLSVERCGTDIRALRLERPGGYEFEAGQWFRLTLQTPSGPLAETFSHCSAPSDPHLELTTRMSGSPFKQALERLVPGDRVRIAGPGGRLRVADDIGCVAFLIGGIGITPVRSVLRDAASRGRHFDDALLLYGNRDETCVPYLGEFEKMDGIGVRVVVAYEHPPRGWTGETGFITADMVLRHMDADDSRPFVVAGPPAMVSAMEAVLEDLGVPAERRMVETFTTTGSAG
jgi:glycine betaine catabolism B